MLFSLLRQPLKASSYGDCHGCSLCILPCPMWRQHRDVMFSPQGLAKSMQNGAVAEDLREVLSSCIMCAACDVMCPEDIAITTIINSARQQLDLLEPAPPQATELTSFIISCDPFVQAQLCSDDLYIIDAAPFHQQHAERVAHYTSLSTQTGCQMNLDLNRMAIAIGAVSLAEKAGMFDVAAQVQWLLQGRIFNRIIVENADDIKILSHATGNTVIHVSELMPRHTIGVK
ncbi:MAG: (Fe-S)-binding protein [Mariprofundaceae bacterium]|nr:(Fe-S)-binding protein [Mariprofundaceae bacterium]